MFFPQTILAEDLVALNVFMPTALWKICFSFSFHFIVGEPLHKKLCPEGLAKLPNFSTTINMVCNLGSLTSGFYPLLSTRSK